jgi:hypothetical protein
MRLKLFLIIILAITWYRFYQEIWDIRNQLINDTIGIPKIIINYLNLSRIFNLQTAESIVLPTEIKILDIPTNLAGKKSLFFSIENIGEQGTNVNVVINDKDWTSDQNIAKTALSQIPYESSAETRSLLLWKYIENNIASRFLTVDNFIFSQLNNPILLFNAFGFGNCGDFASALTILAEEAGLKSRRVDLNMHSVTEIYYDNSWHMFDANLGIIIKNNDGSIASVEEIFNNPKLLDQIKSFPKKYPVSDLVFYHAFTKKTISQYFSPSRIRFSLSSKRLTKMSYWLRQGEKILFFNNFRNKILSAYTDNIFQGVGPIKRFISNGILVTPINYFTNDNLKSKITIYLPYPILDTYVYFGEKCKIINNNPIYISRDEIGSIELKQISECLFKVDESFFSAKDNFLVTNNYSLEFNFDKLTTTETIKVYSIFQLSSNSIPNLKSENSLIKIDSRDITSKLKLTFGVTNN